MDYEQELTDLNIILKREDLKNKLIGISLLVGLALYVVVLFVGMHQIHKQVYNYYGVSDE